MVASFALLDQTRAEYLQSRYPLAWPSGALSALGLIFSYLVFYPGWMSADSLDQYGQARADTYNTWHPVLMAWWWNKLDRIYPGPALMLLQNLLLYWGAWWLMARAGQRWLGRVACLLPILGFWPGLLYPLGQIWKDVCFATAIFFAWALLANIDSAGRRPNWIERAAVFILAVFAFGVKTNGLVVLPLLFWYWAHVEGWLKDKPLRQLAFSAAATIAAVAAAYGVVSTDRVAEGNSFQYTQVYDLLAISTVEGVNLLPRHIAEKVEAASAPIESYYAPGGNDALFFRLPGGLRTSDPAKLAELRERWLAAITTYPKSYVIHRVKNFLALLRVNRTTAAYVASGRVDPNSFGIEFKSNWFSRRLSSLPDRLPFIFFPWAYLVLAVGAISILIRARWHLAFSVSLFLSAVFFCAPHVLVAPASDYRYLYYCYFVACVLGFFAANSRQTRAGAA